MEVMSSPSRSSPDSPSRQLLRELSQLAITSQEGFQAHLDRESTERESLHKKALAAAVAKHDRVRRNVELERERLELQIQVERSRREDETRKEIEQQRQEQLRRTALAEEREVAQAKAAEEERTRIQSIRFAREKAQQKAEKEDQERQRQDAESLRQQQEKQELARKKILQAKAAEARAKAARNTQNDIVAPSQGAGQATIEVNSAEASSSSQNRVLCEPRMEAEHKCYLSIHQRLKKFRNFMQSEANKNAALKKAMGDMRREIKKSVGQVRGLTEAEGKKTNSKQLNSILETLKQASTFPDPKTDITLFLADPPSQNDDKDGPALLIYLLNIFAKALISQLITEAGISPRTGDAIGIIASHIFAIDRFRWKGYSLLDIFLAKFHLVCPVLFGIHGSESTVAGKSRLGWSRDGPDGPFIEVHSHNQRMTGLGSGFAALSLRNYSKASAINPYPEHHYWSALARIAAIPANQLTQTHFVVLKAMIEHYEDKFIGFYGAAAVAALRLVLIELPKKAPQSVASKSLAGVVDILRKDTNLAL